MDRKFKPLTVINALRDSNKWFYAGGQKTCMEMWKSSTSFIHFIADSARHKIIVKKLRRMKSHYAIESSLPFYFSAVIEDQTSFSVCIIL